MTRSSRQTPAAPLPFLLFLLVALQTLVLSVPCQSAKPRAAKQPHVPLYTFDLTPVNQYNLDTTPGKNNTWAEVHAISALQGLVNRAFPQLYVYYVSDDPKQPGRIDRFWLDKMQGPGGWLAKKPLQPIGTLEGVVTKFRSAFRGVVLYDLNVPATSNVASTIAGCDNLLPIPYDPTPGSVYDRLVVHGPKLPIKLRLLKADGSPLFTGAETGSAKCDAYLWAKRKYLDTDKCNPALMAFELDAFWLMHPKIGPANCHGLSNHDYFIAHRAFFFDLSPWDDETPQDDLHQSVGTDFKTMRAILLSAYNATHGKRMICIGGFLPWPWKYTSAAGGHHEPVAAEWHYASIISSYNAYMEPDAFAITAMANASVYAHFPLKPRYPQPKPSLADWKKAGYVDAAGHVVPHEYVTFYNGDYDCAAWLYQMLPVLWTDSARGSIPLNWAFNPNLSDHFPLGMDWVRRTATPNDHFIGGDCGAGYLNPGNLDRDRPFSGLPSGLTTWAAHCQAYYDLWDITLTGFIIDGETRPMSAEALRTYTQFSPAGLVGQKVPSHDGLVPGTQTPYLVMENDMPNPDQIDEAVIRVQAGMAHDSSEGPHFHVFRTILWNPYRSRELYERLQKLPNVTVVDAYTLMGLLRLSKQ